MRRAAKIDDNQPEIVEFLEKHGFSVKSMAAVGDGFPDIIFAKWGKHWLAEIKDGSKVPSKRRLTPDQEKFHSEWRGNIFIIETLADVKTIIRDITTKVL